MVSSNDLKNKGLIAFLLILIIVIGFLSYQNASDYVQLKSAFEEEKKELEIELSSVIRDYEEVITNKQQLSFKLKNELHKMIQLRDTIQNLKVKNYRLINYYRKRVTKLEKENKKLFIKVDSLSTVNTELYSENKYVKKALIEKEHLNVKLVQKNDSLNSKKKILEEKVAVAEVIEVSSIIVETMKKRRNDTYTTTSRFSKIDAFNVQFKLLENRVAEAEKKSIHIQLVNPKNNVISIKGSAELNDGAVIDYSDTILTEYYNEELKIVSFIDVDRVSIFKGVYKINIFVDGVYSGSATMKL